MDLLGVDCPPGVARCVGGIVEVSRAHQYAVPCHGAPEECACPWERLGDCTRGCAVDGVEIDAPYANALTQLCAPSPAEADARATFADAPVSGAFAPACDGEYACSSSSVVRCGPPAVVVARCTRGCAREGQAIDALDDRMGIPEAGVIALFCAR